MENVSPMVRQYRKIKARYPDSILFFRLGDFYEMFGEDAEVASKELNLVLTSREAGAGGRIPMCGLPYHAVETYLARLVKAGFRVAICEQTEDASQAKGLVKREVVREVSAGTFLGDSSSEPRYLAAVVPTKKRFGFAFIEASGGTIRLNSYETISSLVEAAGRLSLREILVPEETDLTLASLIEPLSVRQEKPAITRIDPWRFDEEEGRRRLLSHFGTLSFAGFGLSDQGPEIAAAGGLLWYLQEMNQQPLLHIDRLSLYTEEEFCVISPPAVVGLEVSSLISRMDRTFTAMGRRLLSHWILHPLKVPASILQRQQAVTLLIRASEVRESLVPLLKGFPDIEKALSRISCGYSSPRDLLALRNGLNRLPEMESLLKELSQENILLRCVDASDIRSILDRAINPEMPLSNPEGNIVRLGYNSELDALREIRDHGNSWLKNLQAREIKRTGINSLKIGFNQVFGYYLEVTKPNLSMVPGDYIRKQTLVNAERFITEELKTFEEKMLSSQEKIVSLEIEICKELREKILECRESLHDSAESVATIDLLQAFSEVAVGAGWSAPEIHGGDSILLQDGRHPVVEEFLESTFVPNDTLLDQGENRLLVITGPNMAGKSTYIRQVALLVILAQTGSYIPAASASIGVADKVFARIGARDEIARGQSTFMVEMSETAEILNTMTPKSLVVLDEIGRGTSTWDGLSLAWAVARYLHEHTVRTLFATHYHELTALSDQCSGAKNYNVEVREWEDEIIFLHRIVPGGTDESYGIYVAKLAGIPREVIAYARTVLSGVQKTSLDSARRSERQMTLFYENGSGPEKEFFNQLLEVNPDHLTPLDALTLITNWYKSANKEERKKQS
ncbi:MAG: DNA mismatch repair protein MutS [Candidatus Ratteibacteria bacterium]|jgi:DNA mismatch repair protein MutS